MSTTSKRPHSPTKRSGRPTSSRGSAKSLRESQRTFPNSPPPTPPPTETTAYITPFYMSPIHLPSTNPEFVISLEEESIPEWVDTSSDVLTVSLWGRAASHSLSRMSSKGKTVAVDSSDGWVCHHQWDLDLTRAEPLSEEVRPRDTFVNRMQLKIFPVYTRAMAPSFECSPSHPF